METRKIALVCFVGGVICSAVALAVAPQFWWLGLLAGFSAGYVSYELREIFQAIPITWQVTKRKFGETGKTVFESFLLLKKPHPFFYIVILFAFPIWSYLIFLLLTVGVVPAPTKGEKFFFALFAGGLISINIFIISLVIFFLLLFFAEQGAAMEGYYWKHEMFSQRRRQLVYQEVPLTYRNAYRWIGLFLFPCFKTALSAIFWFFAWYLWWGIGKAVAAIFYGIGYFLWTLFKLVHSHERVLCGVDGSLGGAIAYFLSLSSPMLFSQKILVVFFGGAIGAAIGVFNYEIMTKRLLRRYLATVSS